MNGCSSEHSSLVSERMLLTARGWVGLRSLSLGLGDQWNPHLATTVMAANPDSIRDRLIRLIKQKSKRRTQWTRERPTEWQPEEIADPATGMRMTSLGAWEFILERLEQNCSFQEVTLKKPPNKVGYVMIEELGDQRVYIKLEIGEGDRYIYGRSFHHDLPEEA